jgi:glycosyltransferase involved in cell wall biosynthesis
MNIAVVVPTGGWPGGSIDFGGYCETLEGFGHSPTLVCCGHDPVATTFPVVETCMAEMEQADFWRNLKLDVTIFFNWLRLPATVIAMKQAGLFVISRGDSDGQSSSRVFPKATWLTLEDSNDQLTARLKKAKIWFQRCFMQSKSEDQYLLKCIDCTDTAAIECDEAAENIRRILVYYKRKDLEKKLHVIPHSVRDTLLAQEVNPGPRPRAIICGGRWDAPQKDVSLLGATLEKLLRRQPDLKVMIFGEGGNNVLGPLANRYSGINWLRRVPHEKVPELIADCRIMISSSRWEGYSILGLEALCMGCTLATTPVTSFISMTEQGRFGTISSSRSSLSLAHAIEQELELWERGSRIPAEISAIWRQRANNHAVVSSLLSLIK